MKASSVTEFVPDSVEALVDAVRSAPRVLPIGARTKPRLSDVQGRPPGAVPAAIRLTALRGLIEYDPGEYTFTALAGTPVREIESALGERGQYLPFDPMLGARGATLGGTVASGLSGPGRLRFGGLRDFILGVRFVDGSGRLLRLGGKVVKNAAGFDVPKFFVGSLGRFGILAELTFKVFPRPTSTRTVAIDVANIDHAVRTLAELAVNRWDLRAVDLLPGGRSLAISIGGPPAALELLTREILQRWPGREPDPSEAARVWDELSGFAWASPDGALVKVPTSLGTLAALLSAIARIPGARAHVSGGGQVVYASFPAETDSEPVRSLLSELGLSGLALRGTGPLWWGQRRKTSVESALKHAFDEPDRFPTLDD